MSPEDTAQAQRAIFLANTGKTEEAYKIFGDLYDNGNDEDVTICFWLAYTTSHLGEAELALETIERLESDHPNLPKLQHKIAKWQKREAQEHKANKPQYLQMTCPYCHQTGPARTVGKVSVGGWIWFAVFFLLFLCGLAVSTIMAYTPVPLTQLDQMRQAVNSIEGWSFLFLLLSFIGFFIRKHYYTCGYCGIALGDMA